MRDGLTRRGVLGGLMLSGAMGLGGCVTTPTGSENSAVRGGPDGDSSAAGARSQAHIDSARKGGVMLVMGRYESAPEIDLSFGLMPVTVTNGETVPGDDDSVIEALVSAADAAGQRQVRTFDIAPGTYVVARIDAGSKKSSGGGYTRGPTITNPGLSPLAFGAAVLIGASIAAIANPPPRSFPGARGPGSPYEYNNKYRAYFAKERTIFSPDAIVFTVAPGKVTYIGDFTMAKHLPDGPRIVDYSYNPDMSTLTQSPSLPVVFTTLQRSDKDTSRFYLG